MRLYTRAAPYKKTAPPGQFQAARFRLAAAAAVEVPPACNTDYKLRLPRPGQPHYCCHDTTAAADETQQTTRDFGRISFAEFQGVESVE